MIAWCTRMKLSREFYNRDTLKVAEDLIGKILVREVDGKKLSGKIIETEAYLGLIDKAAHSYGGKITPRVEVLYGEAGFSYVYFIYGMYNCLNTVTKEKGIPEAVLIRGLEPIEGIDEMCINRFGKLCDYITKYQRKNLLNGPGKLCKALLIDKSLNKVDLCTSNTLYIEEGTNEKLPVYRSKRIGIDYAEEAKDFLWRFYIK